MKNILLYSGSILIIVWGVGHLLPTKAVVKGFGPISTDNKRIIAMEWVAEGLTLCFIGILVMLVTLLGESGNLVSIYVYRSSAIMLILMAALTFMTGARTSIIPIKICPVVKTFTALLFFIGSMQ